MKSISKKICIIIVSLLATVLLLECAIRLYDFKRGIPSDGRTYWYWLYEQDPYLGYRGRSSVDWKIYGEIINHSVDGFRESRSLAQLMDRKDKKLIMCVGESSTYGLSAGSFEASYPYRLEKALQKQGNNPNWVVFNAGMPGYTSYEVLQLIQLRLLKVRPDYILLMSLRNDYEFVTRYLDEKIDYDFYPLRLAHLSANTSNEILMRSSLYGFVMSKLRSSYKDDLGSHAPVFRSNEVTERGLRFYLNNLSMIEYLCRISGVKLICVDQPINYSLYSEDRVRNVEIQRKALKEFCTSNHIPLLDAHALLDYKALNVFDDVHLGSAGYERLAEVLALQILELEKKR